MASAGNIILNLPTGGRGPYRVAPQGTVFRALPSRALQNTAAVMGILKQAKDVADMVAPFISQEYQPPVQQGEIAAQRLDTAQQELAAAQQQLKQTQKTFQPMSVEDASVQQMLRANEMLQAAQTPEQVAEAQRLYAQSQESQAAAKDIQQARASMLQAQQERIDPLAQRVALERQAVAEAPPVLPMFNTLAEAEASIRSALMSGNFEEAQQMLAGLEYSPLIDIPRATKIGEIPVEPRRQAAIADMMKRLRIPSELTPARQSLQQQQLDVRQAAIDASRARTEAMVARAKADREARAKLAEEKQAADELKRREEYERKVTLVGIKQANKLEELEKRDLSKKELADINNLAQLKRARLQAWSRTKVARLNNDVRLITASMQGETATRNRAQRRLNKLLTGNSNAKPDVLKRQLTMRLMQATANKKKYEELAKQLEGQTGAKLPEIAAKIASAKAAKEGAETLINLINKKLDSMNATLFRK